MRNSDVRTHDLTARVWGRNYYINKIVADGQWLGVSIIATPLPREGEYVLLRNGESSVRYQVESIQPCGNPRDMANALLSFAPREIEETNNGK